MPIEQSESVTHLLLGWAGGDRNCLDSLILLLDAELRRIAHHYMRLERDGHTLQTTALINEAYLRLVNGTEVRSQHRTQFLELAAHVMRHILVDHARGVPGHNFHRMPMQIWTEFQRLEANFVFGSDTGSANADQVPKQAVGRKSRVAEPRA